MKGGLRLQVVLLLTGVLLVSHVPLFFAVSTYTRIGLDQLQQRDSARLAAASLSFLRTLESGEMDRARQFAASQADALDAIALQQDGELTLLMGDAACEPVLGAALGSARADTERIVNSPVGRALLMTASGHDLQWAVLVRLDASLTGANRLTGLMGLYLLLAALSLAVAGYFALTRWIVRPILTLEHSAARVATGGRRLVIPEQAPREIASLSARLSQMTQQLRDEEEELHRKIAEVQSTSEELRRTQQSLMRSERLATVGRLSAGLAHEIGNPISALMGFIDLLLDGNLSSEEERDFLLRMKKETSRIDRVLSDLLAYARPAGSRQQHQPGSLGEAVRTVQQLVGPQKSFQEVSLSVQHRATRDSVGLELEGLTQVILNLVMNAADACQRKGHVRVTTHDHEAEVELVVEDDGPGVPPEQRDQVFEPFFTTKEVGQGTGLGLSVTRGLIESAGGSIHVERSELGGACFRVRLPRK